MATITLELPNDVTAQEARLALAIGLWLEGSLSQGQAAALCGKTRAEFLETLGQRRLPFTNIGPDELAEEVESWRALRSQTPLP